MISFDGSGLASLVSTLQITVINVNGPSTIQGPTGPSGAEPGTTLKVYALSMLQGSKVYPKYPTSVRVGGVVVTGGSDGDLDFVKVRVQCEYGVVFLNTKNISRLDFTSITYCYNYYQVNVKNNCALSNAFVFLHSDRLLCFASRQVVRMRMETAIPSPSFLGYPAKWPQLWSISSTRAPSQVYWIDAPLRFTTARKGVACR